jgi:Helix-turn-helix domain
MSAEYTILSAPLREELKSLIREVLAEGNGNGAELFTPEKLAEKMKLPVSWVYEQSRQGNIPTHRIGRYLRFSLAEVLESQKKKGDPS